MAWKNYGLTTLATGAAHLRPELRPVMGWMSCIEVDEGAATFRVGLKSHRDHTSGTKEKGKKYRLHRRKPSWTCFLPTSAHGSSQHDERRSWVPSMPVGQLDVTYERALMGMRRGLSDAGRYILHTYSQSASLVHIWNCFRTLMT